MVEESVDDWLDSVFKKFCDERKITGSIMLGPTIRGWHKYLSVKIEEEMNIVHRDALRGSGVFIREELSEEFRKTIDAAVKR